MNSINRQFVESILNSQPTKTTSILKDEDLTHFQNLFDNSLCIQDPAVRQLLIAFTKKIIKRLKDSLRVVLRDTKCYNPEQKEVIRMKYLAFLRAVIEKCFDGLYCNAYFGSYTLILSTLQTIVSVITFEDPNLPVDPLFRCRRAYDSILCCLNDSFEQNKILALDLLLALPFDERFMNTENLKNLELIAYQLVSSVNPAHSLTCQYVFKLVNRLEVKLDPQSTKNGILIKRLERLIEIVELGVQETRENFALALKKNALYPKLTCIRALLNEIDIETIDCDREAWQRIVRKIVSSSIEACESVSTIVCNLNPETIGHLPMDLKPIDTESLSKTLNVSLKLTENDTSTITSQLLLISGWKTIKECSLSLGSICTRFWWPRGGLSKKREDFPGLPNVDPILDSTGIKKIVSFFDHYLRNLRHRGAFEQAYNGFIMVTKRIWHEETYRDLLVKMLHDIMDDFRNEAIDNKKAECLKAYVTRRSAGLPFIVQAILISEPRHESKTLRLVLNCLYEVIESKHTETYQRIHCLNILRAVIKEHHLGEKVLCHVGKTFEITFDCLASDSFPIRNCANMLLKATVDRTFGVNRLKSDIHRKNQLTFGKFFHESSELHGIMIQHLRNGLKSKAHLATVHAVFIVLFRLRPSIQPQNDFKSNAELIQPFIQPILEITLRSPDLRLRNIAAALAVRFEVFLNDGPIEVCPIEHLNNELTDPQIDEWIDNVLHKDFNEVHGVLMIIKHNLFIRSKEVILLAESPQQLTIDRVALKLCEKILGPTYQNRNNWTCLASSALDILGHMSAMFTPNRWYTTKFLLKGPGNLLDLVSQGGLASDPYNEIFCFKFLTLSLMVGIQSGPSVWSEIDATLDLVVKIILTEPGKKFSFSLQGSLIRFLMQQITEVPNYVDRTLERLDIDVISTHLTPKEEMLVIHEQDTRRSYWHDYCRNTSLTKFLKGDLDIRKLLDFSSYQEFQLAKVSRSSFSPRLTNTMRAIELLAFTAKFWTELKVEEHSLWFEDRLKATNPEALNLMCKFLSDLPNCDVKNMALICAGLMFKSLSNSVYISIRCGEILEGFSEMLDELADGDQSSTMRQTCSEVLRNCMAPLLERRDPKMQRPLINLLSTIIKLCQDEDEDIRLFNFETVNHFRLYATNKDELHKSRLDPLIDFVIKLFNRKSKRETANCFDLLMKAIFDHSRNYRVETTEDNDALFDKTKLNTFADHVATIRSALVSLEKFFKIDSPDVEPFPLNELNLTREIVYEFETCCEMAEKNSGDYSRKIRSVVVASNSFEDDRMTNDHLVDSFIDNVLNSLDYFSNGYTRLLTDTSYTYRELSLYKKIAFLRFVTRSTSHDLKNADLLTSITTKLRSIVENHCCTTLLVRCLDLIIGNDSHRS